MPSTAKTKMSIAGSKRKAETAKEVSAKGSKKPKFDSLRSKAQTPKATKPAVKSMRAPVEQNSSDDDFDGLDEDGGVDLDKDEDTDESKDIPVPEQFQGVHPDRVKAAGNGAGPNGMFTF